MESKYGGKAFSFDVLILLRSQKTKKITGKETVASAAEDNRTNKRSLLNLPKEMK